MGVLCPELYERVRAAFGEVIVANAGEEARVVRQVDPVSGKERWEVQAPGEYFRVSCPYCGDTKHRLYINHRLAEFPWMATCFNEGCLEKSPARREQMLFLLFGPGRPAKLAVHAGKEPLLPGPGGEVPEPGLIWKLTDLEEGHPAREYLEGRGFDVRELERDYGVGFCLDAFDPRYGPLEGRIYVPVYFGGKLVGWQGRLPGEPAPGSRAPKYFTMPLFKKGQVLYNYDAASCGRDVWVVEGVTDVWSAGPQAVGLLGKTPTAAQAVLLASWARTGGVLVCLLDGEVDVSGDAKWDGLRAAFGANFLPVRLPGKTDPGDVPTAWLHDYVRRAARRAGVKLSEPAGVAR